MHKLIVSAGAVSLLALLSLVWASPCLADIPPFGGGHRHRPQPPAVVQPKDPPPEAKDKQDPPPPSKDKKDAPAKKPHANDKSKAKSK